MKNFALYLATLAFLTVSGAHFYRYYHDWQVQVGPYNIPNDWSITGGAITFLLALVMFIAAKKS